MRCENDLKDNKDNSLHLGRKYARIFALGHYLFLVAHSFLELRSRKTVRFSEQIMSADKYPSIFSRQMETIKYHSKASYNWHVVTVDTLYTHAVKDVRSRGL